MLKNILYTFVLIFLFINNSYGNILEKIIIKGNQRISPETIIVLANLNEKENYDDQLLNESLKRLYNSNFFENIIFNFEEGILTISVIENPIIEKLEITGIKSKTIIEEISKVIFLKDRMSYNKNLVSVDIKNINNLLKTNGYYFADVKSSFEKNEMLNSVKLKYNIDLGKKAKIKKISFLGDKKIKDKKLLEIIASEEHKFWKFISNNVYLNEGLVNLDKRLLESYYKNLGYYNVKVLSSFAAFDNNDNSFELLYNIASGNKFYFNEFKLNLPIDYNPDDFNVLNKIFLETKNELYSINKLNKILSEINKIASLKLYEFIDAKVDEQIVDQNKLNFTINIIDTNKFYVEKINIVGNYITIEEVIRNKFVVDEGDPLNNLLLSKSLDNIRSLGIFEKVNANTKDGKDDNYKEIDIIVEEKATGEFSLAAGIGTAGSSIGGGVKEKNFLGKAIDLSTFLEISDDSIKGEFIYSKPNFAYTDNTLSTSIRSTTSDFMTDSGYKISNIGFSIGTEFQQYENFFFNPSLSIDFESLTTNDSANNSLKKQEGSYNDFYFNYGLTYDRRNSNFEPTNGNITRFSQELPVISDNNEISNTIIFTQYKELNVQNQVVGKASLYLSSINSLDGSDARISKRKQVPYNRLRGFQKGKIGPKDGDDYVGGNYVASLNLSSNIPTIFNTVENVDFYYFFDVANVWGVDFDDNLDDYSSIRSSSGLGMNFLTPIGPLSFSYAFPITKKSTDKTESFRFNIGTSF